MLLSFAYLAFSAAAVGRAAVQIGASEGTRDPVAATRAGDPAPAATAGTGSTRGSGNSGGARRGATAEGLVKFVGASRDGSALAPAAGQAALDVSAQTAAGAAAARSSGTGARRSTRTREPILGLPADRRRTARPRHLDFGDLGADDPHPPRSAAGAAARRALLAQLPPPTRCDDARLRFLHRRDRLAETNLRALIPLARAPPDRVRRLHPQPDRRLDSPTGAQPADDARRSAATAALADPRSRRQVRRRLRPCLSERRDHRDPHTRAGAERERPRRALDRQRPSRVPRPAAHLQPPPARARASRLCPSLQPASAAPLARILATRTTRQKPDASTSTTISAAQSPRPTRRPDPRIRIRSLTRSISPTPTTSRALCHALSSTGRRIFCCFTRAREYQICRVDVNSTRSNARRAKPV